MKYPLRRTELGVDERFLNLGIIPHAGRKERKIRAIAGIKMDSVKIIVAMARKAVSLRDVFRDNRGLRGLSKGLKQRYFMLTTKQAGTLANYLGADITEIMAGEGADVSE